MEVYIAEIRSMVEDGYTHEQISEFLQQQNYRVCGFSARSIRRFCSDHSIHYRSTLSVQELDRVIHNGVITVMAGAQCMGCWHSIWGEFLKEESTS